MKAGTAQTRRRLRDGATRVVVSLSSSSSHASPSSSLGAAVRCAVRRRRRTITCLAAGSPSSGGAGGGEPGVELFAADEPRAVPRTDQKKELAKKALEQAFQGKENLFAKLDDQGNDGSGNGSGDRGGGGGGGGGNNDEDWGEVFNMAVKIVIYLFIGIVFLVVWPKFFSGASNVYNKLTNKEVVAESGPVKEDFDDADFEELMSAGPGEVVAAAEAPAKTSAGANPTIAKKASKRVFPEREAFDTWQFGASKGLDGEDELRERELQMETVKDEMMDPTGRNSFHDEFNSKPRSKHHVFQDLNPKEKPGPYQEYISNKWK